jgi:hypothetical protein
MLGGGFTRPTRRGISSSESLSNFIPSTLHDGSLTLAVQVRLLPNPLDRRRPLAPRQPRSRRLCGREQEEDVKGARSSILLSLPFPSLFSPSTRTVQTKRLYSLLPSFPLRSLSYSVLSTYSTLPHFPSSLFNSFRSQKPQLASFIPHLCRCCRWKKGR